jgi:hypothetical protein
MAGNTGGNVYLVEVDEITFEQFLEIEVPEGTTHREVLRMCWDAAYAEGHTDGLLKHIRSEYDRNGKAISNA